MTPKEKTKIPTNNKLANPSCRHCYGTGKAGFNINGADKTLANGTKKKAPRTPIVCRCVDRARTRTAPWLQRHGKDNQPWLQG